MIVALGVMLVTSLLLVAAFSAANGDIKLTHEDSTQKQAYYAALAGIQEYEYKLQVNPDYWESCAVPPSTITGGESYEVKLLTAESAPSGTTACSITKPFETMIESKGAAVNTFRVESVGRAGTSKRTIIATFQVTGFLNYVYYTDYEDEDPELYSPKANCEVYRSDKRSSECQVIVFTSEDDVNGPLHTNDSPDICGKVTFGRAEHTPPDPVEIYGTPYSEGCERGVGNEATYNTTSKSYTKGTELVPPQSDTTLEAYVEKEYQFEGVTHLKLNGLSNTITVTTEKEVSKVIKEETKTIAWPPNGLIYVRGRQEKEEEVACPYVYSPSKSDNKEEKEEEVNCGNVYVEGTYAKSLTIGSEDDLIIDGSIYPTSVEGKLGSAPTGTTALGLIANNYVRIYHPIKEEGRGGCSNETGSLPNVWIYAAILSTEHSFLVDNFECGESLGKLNVYGAIAQKFRGIVGTTGGTGYLKNYNYDERLAVDEPPYFLSPLNAGWKVVRETSPTAG
jgi:Tfp pilus assembly protein PilX